MSTQFYFPQDLPPEEMDMMLANGWFRSSNMLYRAQLTILYDSLYSIVRTRLPLANYTFKKRLRKIMNRCNSRFRIEMGRASITPEKEALYQTHKHRFKGYIAKNLEDYFNDPFDKRIFDTREIRVYDGDELIAVSFFDQGEKSIASLLGLFNHEYSKFSLGTFTMLMEIQYGMAQGLRYFYPGYVLPGNSDFDYKLRLGNMEYYNPRHGWHPFSNLKTGTLQGEIIKRKMRELKAALDQREIPNEAYLYPLYDLDIPDYMEGEFLTNPMFIHCYPTQTYTELPVVTYNFKKNTFSLGIYHHYTEHIPVFPMGPLESIFDRNNCWLVMLIAADIIIESEDMQRVVDQFFLYW